MELGNGDTKPLEQKDFSFSGFCSLQTLGKGIKDQALEGAEVQSIAHLYQRSECLPTFQSGSGHDGSQAGLSKNPLEGSTQVPISSAFSQSNVAVPSNSFAPSSLFVFSARAEGDKRENNLPHHWYQNGFQFPNSQDYSINHSSPIMEKVIAPVTPDKCKRSGSDRIKEGYVICEDDTGSDRKGSAHTICFGQCSSEPANISCAGIPLQSEGQEQQKAINFSVDSNSNYFCQPGLLTPDKLKGMQGFQLAKFNVADSKETGECRENYDGMGPSCKETVEICFSECTLQQSVSNNSKFSQQHNLLQEIQCNEGAELNKTPPQKARRKRHRPKVVVEGKPPSKPKQTIPKSESSPDDTPCKKRSVRKKEVGSAIEPKKCVRASARKSLNFDVEEVHVADGSQASTWCSKYDTVSCLGKTFNNSCQNEIVNSAKTALNLQENQAAFPQYPRKQILRENLKVLARKENLKTKKIERSDHHNSINDQILNVPAIYKKRRTDNRKNKFDVVPVRSSFSETDAENNLDNKHFTTYLMHGDQTERRMTQQSKILVNIKENSQTTGKDWSNLPLVPYVQGAGKRVASSATPLNVPRKKIKKKENQCTQFFGTANPSSSYRIMSSDANLIDFITQRMEHLNINRSLNGIPLQGSQDYNALVIYSGGGTIVPFESFFAPRKRPRAKVDLDSETNRVWMLLMGKTDGNFPEGTDIDKEKWWEGERKVFQGRADSFIARMHLIQGDRRFSKWKGSVVDSVVGVFLTQNVSDHLSSSAFMSLAARFPKSSGDECFANAVNQNVSKENKDIAVVEQSDNIKGQQDHINNQQSSKILSSYQNGRYKEENKTSVFGCSEASVSTESRIELENVVSSQNSDIFQNSVVSSQNSDVYQKSVVSSQHSSESPVLLIDQIGLSSESDPVIEDLETGNCSNSSGLTPSFTGHLQVAEGLVSKKIHDNQLSLSKCDEFEYRSLMSDHLMKLDKGISTNQLNFDHCPQHDPVDGEPGPTVANETKCATMNNIKIVQESQSLPSINLGSTSVLDAAETCITGSPSGKITTKFHVQEKSAYNDSRMFTRDHSVQPFPCSSVYACWQSHSRDCNCTSEKTKSSGINEQSILLCDHIAKCNHNEKETNIYAEGMHVELGSSPKANHGSDHSHLDQHSQPSISGLTELSCSTGRQESIPYDATELIIEDKKVDIKTEKEVTRQRKATDKKQSDTYDWDSLRREALSNGGKRERSANTMDSVDWEKVRCADVSETANAIRERGMNNRLAARIKEFLERLVKDHGSIDLEWLRDVPPDRVKDYLLSIQGLGLKSVECVRLLTLEHLAFPVDTNVGRICVRLGWVPLQPLPESVQLHLLELYPMLETIQKYLWPRLCRLDQRTLYELHYQMITFGKVFCTKSKPNCNACPMRGECKHFASAFASARLALPGPEDTSLATLNVPSDGDQIPRPLASQAPFLQLEGSSTSNKQIVSNCEPFIEEPATPEPEPSCVEEALENEIEDAFHDGPDEIPTIKLNIERFTQNLQTILQESNDLEDADMSKALVALTPEAASIPQPKLKNINRLRTEHQVYELPDGHPLLAGLERREPDDPCPYLLAIWTPGETAQSMEAPETSCCSHLLGKLCDSITCFSCNSVREAKACKVRGTLLIPCRTAMRGSFPLNGTYFQVNEVFADHCSSLSPLDIRRELIWNLPRRTVYFGTSVPTIFRGLTTEGIQHCFWRGFVCVRGFDQKTRAPRPLLARLHFPASKVTKNGKKTTAKEAK